MFSGAAEQEEEGGSGSEGQTRCLSSGAQGQDRHVGSQVNQESLHRIRVFLCKPNAVCRSRWHFNDTHSTCFLSGVMKFRKISAILQLLKSVQGKVGGRNLCHFSISQRIIHPAATS